MSIEAIRVFARRTKMSPTDDLAFYGEPPLFDLPNLPVEVSVTFTWDVERGFSLYDAWRRRCSYVRIGGPVFQGQGPHFQAGRFLKPGVTITSRGCPNRCPWCIVPEREGPLHELQWIEPGYIVQDNNLLACSDLHIERVFDMLLRQPRTANFTGGLEAKRLQPWHVDWLRRPDFRLGEAWFAYDLPGSFRHLERAADLMSDFPLRKKRCYVLAGFLDDDTPAAAEARCDRILELGFCPFLMLYQPTKRKVYDAAWKSAQRKWTRPAAYLSVPSVAESGGLL